MSDEKNKVDYTSINELGNSMHEFLSQAQATNVPKFGKVLLNEMQSETKMPAYFQLFVHQGSEDNILTTPAQIRSLITSLLAKFGVAVGDDLEGDHIETKINQFYREGFTYSIIIHGDDDFARSINEGIKQHGSKIIDGLKSRRVPADKLIDGLNDMLGKIAQFMGSEPMEVRRHYQNSSEAIEIVGTSSHEVLKVIEFLAQRAGIKIFNQSQATGIPDISEMRIYMATEEKVRFYDGESKFFPKLLELIEKDMNGLVAEYELSRRTAEIIGLMDKAASLRGHGAENIAIIENRLAELKTPSKGALVDKEVSKTPEESRGPKL